MKLFKIAAFAAAVAADGHSTYEECGAAACDYACGNYENCDGSGRKGLIGMSADTVCCGVDDVATICTGDAVMEAAACMTLPANITAITGAACK